MSDPAGPERGWTSVPSPSGLEARPDSAPSADPDAPTSGTAASGAADRPVGRQAPGYGEYAPEGWVNPVFVEQERRDREDAARVAERETEALRWKQAGGGPDGIRRAGAVPPGRIGDRTSDGRPAAGAARLGRTPGDLLVTILLLVFGLISVLQQLSGIGQLASEVAKQVAARYTELSDPSALVPATTVSAIAGAVILGLAIWWSAVRLRRRKWTFWVPLAAGALAGIVSTISYVVVIMNDPAFVAWMASHS